ncbi:IgA peptidase M64-domain-containing protein [Suillus clintonianus]|uniref:IgA peptidase M64-domain-containing protein n=1 Tax=Suillus clintonianus TaxID=1904413 RepID=UPI001B86B24A|nr:IgA peptidase M64-domain-containing protein [Suillus clintonianus]KAG2131805.1 IgA peptidase M64-domain-containing protein [Suillus clintonianus]
MKTLLATGTVAFALVAGAGAHWNSQPYQLTLRREPNTSSCEIVSFGEAQLHKSLPPATSGHIIRQQNVVPSAGSLGAKEIIHFLSHSTNELWLRAQLECLNDLSSVGQSARNGFQTQVPFGDQGILYGTLLDVPIPPLEVVSLLQSGQSDNRIDLAFFSDGYTIRERDKFLDDAMRLVTDLSANQTFATVRPLLNFWAVFSPSQESGVGVNGKAKRTPFGLYRDGTELRGLYANNSDVALMACASIGNKCNYAILLGNDPLYGGLGGEYTTTTASLANGALVLRHEIGHSIIDVGEEYDGGYAYFGVNAAHNLSAVTWTHWLEHQEDDDIFRAQRSVMPMQAYPWTLLSTTQPWSISFLSSGNYARHLIKFSLSGLPDRRDLDILFDGVDLHWAPRKDIGFDRWHYDVFEDTSLSAGSHEISFVLKNSALEGSAQLCSVEILEYGTEAEFNATFNHYGMFPTFSLDNETSYRPTNDDCLMRSVTKPNFCKVCLEGLWLSLLKRIDLIEEFRITCERDHHRSFKVDLVPLAEFRESPVSSEESYRIAWSKDGKVLPQFANMTHIDVSDEVGTYRVDVQFLTEEVRVDKDGLLSASRSFTVTETCA